MSDTPVATKEAEIMPALDKFAQQMAVSYKQAKSLLMDLVKTRNGHPASPAQQMAFICVAAQYNLNPFLKEIHAFEGKGGQIIPVVGVDGWLKLARREDPTVCVTHTDHTNDKGEVIAITAHVWRGCWGDSRSCDAKEYMSECKNGSQVWNKWPIRMLRHKATIQAIRLGFSFGGIYDEDEAHRIRDMYIDTKYVGHDETKRLTSDEVNAGLVDGRWLKKQWDEGYQAGLDMDDAATCPYSEDDPPLNRTSWLAGWQAGHSPDLGKKVDDSYVGGDTNAKSFNDGGPGHEGNIEVCTDGPIEARGEIVPHDDNYDGPDF